MVYKKNISRNILDILTPRIRNVIVFVAEQSASNVWYGPNWA
jgi:hypothetical protein